MIDILDVLLQRLPGSWAVRDGKGMADGHIATLPACDVARRGERRRVDGGAGVADRWVVCEKSAADVYAWQEKGRAALDAAYTGGAASASSLSDIIMLGGM